MIDKKFIPFFCFLLSAFLLLEITSCTSPTETPKGSLTGTVSLEDLSDHSGITIALYDLAYLDTTIVRINNQYPQIGVHINQHTEFDHRLQSPIKSTETEADGSFELTKIPTGTYNLVAMKAGFGFKYIYEFEIEKDDNELTQQITLYKETPYTNQVPTTTFLTDHHYIIDNPYGEVILYNNSLTIEPGAVVRITPNTDFKILGTLIAQGEENNMFWVTSNDGFLQEEDVRYKVEGKKYKDESLNPYPLSLIPDRSEELLLYNSMELSSIASVSDDLIEWGKWDYGNTCLLNQVNSLYIQNGIFRDGNCGFKSTDVDSIFCEELLINNCFGETGAISLDFVPNGYIKQNIIINTFIGIYLDNESSPQVNNNYIKSVEEGIYSRYSCLSIINNNEIICNNLGISIRGLCNETINYNNIYARIGVDIKPTGYSGSSIANINNNNINGIDFAIKIMGTQWGPNVNDIDANNNYYYTNNEDLINALVFDKNDVEEGSIPFTGLVLWEPFETQQLLNAGIQ